MNSSDHHPKLPEPFSSSSEIRPAGQDQERSGIPFTPSGSTPRDCDQEDSEPDHTPPAQDSSSTSSSSRPSIQQRSRQTTSFLLVAGALIAALFIGGSGGWFLGNHPTGVIDAPINPSEGTAAEQAVEKVRTAVVLIHVQKSSNQTMIGSGVLIDPRGYIVTNNHVVEGQQSITVMSYDGSSFPAQVTGTAPADDLAVVHITPPKNITVASIGDSSKLKVAQRVLVIGNPLGITQTVTEGIVSALGRTVREGTGHAIIVDAVQTDAAINPGNSGGALIDLQGKLIGIPTLTAIDPQFNTPANGVGFAIPSNRVQFIVPQLIDSGKVVHSGRASLGAQVITVNPIMAARQQLPIDHGALVVGVASNSPAEQAGLHIGDIIVQIDNTPLESAQQLQDVLLRKDVGQMVSLKMYRGNQQLTVKAKLGEFQMP